MHLNYTGQPNESEESEISSEDDCSKDGENILDEYRKNKFTLLPDKKTTNLIVEKSVVSDPKNKLKKGMSFIHVPWITKYIIYFYLLQVHGTTFLSSNFQWCI